MSTKNQYKNESLLALLREVEQFLSDGTNWCASAVALDAKGKKVSWDNPSATRWNMIGSVLYVGSDYTGAVTLQALGQIGQAVYSLKKMSTWEMSERLGRGAIVECVQIALKNIEDLWIRSETFEYIRYRDDYHVLPYEEGK